ncbi:hypothetical protein EVAR_52074_1 [Eumeta japonica]|uniref:Uncharacterized protein n=1 Tax=Eumeta variegata TaxID=151549 RepID=A0A4C1Y4W6_EUMVA|nr:hypothetical protein EVAR_52074_1 [Eumeta japonica]
MPTPEGCEELGWQTRENGELGGGNTKISKETEEKTPGEFREILYQRRHELHFCRKCETACVRQILGRAAPRELGTFGPRYMLAGRAYLEDKLLLCSYKIPSESAGTITIFVEIVRSHFHAKRSESGPFQRRVEPIMKIAHLRMSNTTTLVGRSALIINLSPSFL